MGVQLTTVVIVVVLVLSVCWYAGGSPTTVLWATPTPASELIPEPRSAPAVGKSQMSLSRLSTPSGRRITAVQDAEAVSLGRLLRTVVQEALAECDLLVVVGGGRGFVPWDSMLHHLLLQLPNPRQVMHMAVTQVPRGWVQVSTRCRGVVYLMDEPEPLLTLTNMTSSSSSSWDYDGKTVVVGLTREQLQELTFTKSGRKTQNIVGVVKSEQPGKWWVYMNQLFVGEGLTPVTVWKDDKFIQKHDLFPNKLANLHGAALRVVTLEYAPVLFFQRARNGSLMYRYGRDMEIINALSQVLNFTMEFLEVPPGELWGERLENGSFNGLIGFLSRDEADIASGNMYISSHLGRLEHQSFSAAYSTDQSCFTARVEPPLPHWQSLGLPYQLNTWLALLVGLLICSTFLYTLTRISTVGTEILSFQSLIYSSLYVFGMHFRESQSQMPLQSNTQIFVAFLWTYVIIITTGYSSNLTAFLTVTRDPEGIETIKELHESKLPVFGLGEYFKYSMLQSMNKHVRGLADHYVVSFDVDEVDKLIMTGKGVSIQGRKYQQYVIKKRYTSTGGHASMRILKECFASHSITLGLQRHSPLKSIFDRVISWVVESGLVDRWFLESINLSIQNEEMNEKVLGSEDVETEQNLVTTGNEGVIPLGLDHMQGIFLILIFSYLVSTLIFLTETTLMKNYI